MSEHRSPKRFCPSIISWRRRPCQDVLRGVLNTSVRSESVNLFGIDEKTRESSLLTKYLLFSNTLKDTSAAYPSDHEESSSTFDSRFCRALRTVTLPAQLLSTTSIAKMFHIKGVMVYFVTFRLLRVARLMVAVPQLRIIITTFVNIGQC